MESTPATKVLEKRLSDEDDLSLPFQLTPAQQIIDMLKTIRKDHLSSDQVQANTMRQRIDYAIEKIGQRNIFDVDIVD